MASTVAKIKASLLDNLLHDRLPRYFVLHHDSHYTLPGDATVHTHRVLLINEIHTGKENDLMKQGTVTNRQVYIGEKFHEVSVSAAASFVLFVVVESVLRTLQVETT
jgi:hypothetical protein